MSELIFCNKCGNPYFDEIGSPYHIGSKCLTCNQGTFIGTGVDYHEATRLVDEEYKTTHDGDYPTFQEARELLRQKYFYGKLDQNKSYSAVQDRKYSESPEGIEEQNQRTRELYRKRRDGESVSSGPKCPRCGSTAVSAGQRGYSLFSGFFGSSKTMNRCANCGHKWYPGR